MGLAHLSASLLALAGSVIAADLQPIEVKGSKLFYKNGTQFFMKGVAYQSEPGTGGKAARRADVQLNYKDPLADEKACKRDVPLLRELGTNVIRTYAIDPKVDHTACMSLLNDAGIYVISDLSEPDNSINRNDPQWNTKLYSRYTAVIDELAKYPNVIGFFAGNEVSNAKNNTAASAFVKAAVRDSKAYIKNNKKITRWIGVGYAANDDKDIRKEIADYFNCDNPTDSIDYWGYNIYSWCGDSDLKTSGYDQQAQFFKDYSVPVFFAEYGCNLPSGAAKRKFKETGALYSDAMTGVFSGGIVYMYHQEANDYGLVSVKGDKATKLDDFDALKKEVNGARPKAIDMADYKPTGKLSDCPQLNDNWQANKALPPTPDQSLCDCMSKSRACVPKSDISEKKIGEIFAFICGKSPSSCAGIKANATLGVFGAYSMCDDKAKLAYVLDAYYNAQNKAKDACDFDGAAQVASVNSDSSCSAALASASEVNKKVATATAPVGGGAAKSTGTGDSFAVHGAPVARILSIGDFAVGLYMLVAFGVGAAMITL